MNDNFIIFTISGGIGKNVLATAVVKAIKKSNPDSNIIILTSYRDVWLYNPNVHKVYLYGQAPYFYSNYIKDKKNTKIFNIDPYQTNDYILKKKHLIEIWCDLCGVPFKNEKPELFFNQREVDYVSNIIGNNKNIFLIQTNGGMQQDVKVSWMRDMPLETAQEIVERFKTEYRIIHIRRKDQPQLNGVESFICEGSMRELFCLIKLSNKRLFIDSFCQHVASAINKESTVLWVRNNPEVLGYSLHNNIVTNVEDEFDVLFNSLLEPYNITGNIYECPFKEGTKLFDTDIIIESLMKQENK